MNKFLAKNNLKESYTVYGLNNCIAVLNSDIKLEIKYIYLDKSSKYLNRINSIVIFLIRNILSSIWIQKILKTFFK